MKFDMSGMKAYQKKVRGLKSLSTSVMKQELNTITDRHLSRVIKNTDVGDSPDSPTLRNAWDRTEVVSVKQKVKSEVFNNTEYASYYEYGHRQQVGRVVFIELSAGTHKYGQVAKLQKNGKSGIFIRLKKPFVKGKFVVTKSEEMAQKELDYAAKKISKIIEEGYNG